MLSPTNNMPSAVPVPQNRNNLVATTNTSNCNNFLNISKLKLILKEKKDTLHDHDNTTKKIQGRIEDEYLKQIKVTIRSTIESSLSEVGNGVHNIQILTTNIRNIINNKRNVYKIDVEILKNHPQLKTILSQSGDHWLSNFGTENTQNFITQNGLSPKKELKAPEGLEIVTTVKSDEKFNLPPSGTLVRKEFEVGSKAWILKTNLLGIWEKGTILRISDNGNQKMYRVRFDTNKLITPKFCFGKHLAYAEPSEVLIPVGTRIIAKYTDQVVSAMYAGVIAEPPKATNNGRYLIFFDDGYAQYISQHDINVVREQSEDVSEDVHEKLRDFIKSYLAKYPERPMVKLQVNQFTKTELNSEWCDTKVVEVDASMVKLVFLKSQSTEWVYRGSTRLQPLYNELTNAASHRLTGKPRRQRGLPRKPNQPYVEYTTEIVTISDSDSEDETESGKPSHKIKNTARKSTGGSQTKYLNDHVSSDLLVAGGLRDIESHLGQRKIIRFASAARIKYEDHICSPVCGEFVNQEDYFNNSPLSIPILCGWERQVWKFNDEKIAHQVMYRSKCGRHLRNMDEVYHHLLTTNASVTIDLFSDDVNLMVFRSFEPNQPLYCNEDIAEGQEKTRISCINSLNDQPPPYVEYASERFPGEGVHLNLDENFLCCCSCTDNCQNPLKCECQRITNYARYGQYSDEAPYRHRRLKDNIVTGIYECNKLCPCNQHCTNKVAQNGIKVRLQMFKTQFKGWGIRCLDDIDAGMFICVYAGQLLTEQGADEDGNQFGDEYLAELDHIEVVERIKEGYESDVVDMDVDYDPVRDFKQDYSDEEPVKKKRRGRKGKSTGGATKSSRKSNQSTKYVKQVKKPLTESSDSELNMCNGSDSDFDSSLRTTASSTYATRSKRRSAKRKNDTLPPVNGNADSSSSIDVEKIDDSKELPDIKTSFDSISLHAAPLSPKSAEIVEKAEIKRKPKFSEVKNHVVKKSSSAKNSSQSTQNKKPVKYMPIRDYYKEDGVYIMDAKSKGNIGRYLNHSCNPNVFVQNVFVDTHDLRFPWVSFFAQHFILAGTELTWDYNYEVGSVTNKVMYCYCDSSNCRGRLL